MDEAAVVETSCRLVGYLAKMVLSHSLFVRKAAQGYFESTFRWHD
jgi:hypothetical protein